MKHTKKKRRSRASKQVGCNNDNTHLPNGDKDGSDLPEGEKEEERGVLNCLVEAFASASLEEAAVTFQKAEGDAHKAAVILGGLQEDSSDQTRSSCSSLCGSSASSSSSSEVFVRTNCGHDALGRKGSGGRKSKKVVATTGMVSSVLGKNYLMSSPRRDSSKQKGCSERSASREDKEQFLCSMLGGECELSMAVVQDVLCQCGYEVEKALNMLLELSACSYEQSKNSQSCGGSTNHKEDSFRREFSDNLTSKASDSTSHSSESDLQDNLWSLGYHCRNYSDILAGSEFHCQSSPGARGSNLLPQMVLESLFNTPKTSEHEPSTMNWRNVVKKMESLGQKFEFPPSCTEESQQFIPAKGDEYLVFRKAAKQHWDSMKTYYQKAASAYFNGEREYATYLSEQGRLSNKMAREADEKASQEIFRARNKSIENVITIDLHGQHVKQAMRLLKLHLLFGAYGRSVQSFRVITGCGSHGVGKSKLKQSVISLIESEGIEWHEENRGTVLIRLNGQREFSFLDAESDSE